MWFLFVPVAAVILGAALGVYILVEMPGALRRGRVTANPRPALPSPAPPTIDAPDAPAPAPPTAHPAPRRLEDLEVQLARSLGELRAQIEHLHQRQAEIASKEGRSGLASRYAEDAGLLERRAARMRRVLGLLWKTRAILGLRAALARAAQERPALEALPDVDAAGTDLPAAERAYHEAAQRVRRFLERLRAARGAIDALPEPHPDAVISETWRADVETERARASASFERLDGRMDRLADTLTYLADRARTRQVARGGPPLRPGADGAPDALLEELEHGLAALDELAEAGERKLDELGLANLAEDISQLEQAGLEAQAEADAALEVAKLLGER